MLLKNGKNGSVPLLPLPKKASKVLVAGTHADNLGYQCGGWTIKWQGFIGNEGTSGKQLSNMLDGYCVDASQSIVFLGPSSTN